MKILALLLPCGFFSALMHSHKIQRTAMGAEEFRGCSEVLGRIFGSGSFHASPLAFTTPPAWRSFATSLN